MRKMFIFAKWKTRQMNSTNYFGKYITGLILRSW